MESGRLALPRIESAAASELGQRAFSMEDAQIVQYAKLIAFAILFHATKRSPLTGDALAKIQPRDCIPTKNASNMTSNLLT